MCIIALGEFGIPLYVFTSHGISQTLSPNTYHTNSKYTRGFQSENEAKVDYSKIFLPDVTKRTSLVTSATGMNIVNRTLVTLTRNVALETEGRIQSSVLI